MERARILVAEDKDGMRRMLERVLAPAFELALAADGTRALSLLRAAPFDVVLTDVRMPGADGFDVLRAARERPTSPDVILMTAFATIPMAVEAIRQGAFDYLHKPFDPDDLSLVIARALERRRAGARVRAVSGELSGLLTADGAEPPWACELLDRLARAVDATGPVLLVGEPGVGKARVAQALHRLGARAQGPFVHVGCAELRWRAEHDEVPGPMASAFGVATGLRAALVRANGGTLYLDAVAELPAHHQEVLARELANLRRLEETSPTPVAAARVVASSRQPPGVGAGEGALCPALLEQLGCDVVHLPPLRERRGDVAALAAQLLRKHGGASAGFEPEAQRALAAYDWPGNVRELEQVVAHVAAHARGGAVRLTDLPAELAHAYQGALSPGTLLQLPFREAVDLARERASRDYLVALLRELRGNVTRAAERAGMERESLHRLLKRYGLRSEDFKPHA